MLHITFLSVGCADGIHIRYFGNDDKWHNIIIDGGRNCTYQDKVKSLLEQISENGECIDMWIITHIDDDHIGALLYALQHDLPTLSKCNFYSSMVIYNYNCDDDYILNIHDSDLKSLSQGINLVDLLKQNNVTVIDNITNISDSITSFGAKIIFLSPNNEYYKDFINKWRDRQIAIKHKEDTAYKSSHNNDYKNHYYDLINCDYTEDKSVWNKSSIAILFEYSGRIFAFTADSSANTLYDSLLQLGYSVDNKIGLEFMQLPHHGSKYNISKELLGIIDCSNFIVSANAINKHNLPNKEALSRVIYTNNKNNTNIHFTAYNDELRDMFSIDNAPDVTNTRFGFTNSNIKISLEDGKIIYSTDTNK